MLKNLVKFLGGDPNKRTINKLAQVADEINNYEPQLEKLSDEALRAKTNEFRRRLAKGETLDDILPEAFAAVREASKRTIGLRHYDIQMIGAMVLHNGRIAEMRTGEGKTLVATLPLYLRALELNPVWVERARERWGNNPDAWTFTPLDGLLVGRGAHLVTVNDYLARRDARWKAPIYQMLGLSVGVLQMAARTDHGKLAYLINLEKESTFEDQHQLETVPRKLAYAADITYGTTNEYGFDYLRDNMKQTLEERVQRGHYYAIVDEVDNVLIDEARTPLIISGPSHDDAENYYKMAQVVRQLRPEDYEVEERSRSIALTEIGEIHVEQILGEPIRDPDRPEDISPEQARLLGYLEQALRAQFVYKRNKEYLVQGGKVVIVDENTGRLMPGRRWSDGLHQAIEAKEGVKVESENVTYATVTIQNYYRMYERLAGMTGTAATEAEEFDKIYKLDVTEMATNLDYQALRPHWPLTTQTAKDSEGYKYTYYAHKDTPTVPFFFKRKDYPDVIYRTEEAKFRAIVSEIIEYHAMGRPMLVGTTSVELSERLSSRLKADPIQKLAQVLILRDAWMAKNKKEFDGRQIPELEFLNRPLGLLPAKQLSQMSRDLEVPLSIVSSENLDRLLGVLGLSAEYKDRLTNILKNGIPHQVLNARKHTEESQIIAGAGAYGAVTIATNMAGRGVDIKLGGELPEDVLSEVNRVLKRAGNENAYDLTLKEKETALRKLTPEDYGIYEEQVNAFLKYMHESEQVKKLGGLHVIGSERHDSRRIDNQLRGRAARQGDPGSSRFYLSLQDNLMRIFGGQQVEGMMERLKVDEDFPLEMGLVSRMVEQSQTRVEGANFDTRKHLLEYDDVLNKQRGLIYEQRDRILTKHDLSDDANEMLKAEVERRVPEAFADGPHRTDEEGPWKLLSWLEQTQPPLVFGNLMYPSYTVQLLFNEVKKRGASTPDAALNVLLDVTEKALKAEEDHVRGTVEHLLESSLEGLEKQLKERQDTLEVYLEGLGMGDDDEEEGETKSPRNVEADLTSLLRVPIKIDYQLKRDLENDTESAAESLTAQMETYLSTASMRRVIAIAERGLRESLEMAVNNLPLDDWDKVGDELLKKIKNTFEARRKRYLGDNQDGTIAAELKQVLSQVRGEVNDNHLLSLLFNIPQGTRTTFDRKTKQRVFQRSTRLVLTFYAAHLLENTDPEDAMEQILAHLQTAQQNVLRAIGLGEFNRLGKNPLNTLPRAVRQRLQEIFGEDKYRRVETQPLAQFSGEDVATLVDELGRQMLTQTYRQLMLRVIDSLWIEYLTQMESLRVSVGLEAYAQRDPLVTYKAKASELFQSLLNDTRAGVVSRLFTFRGQASVQTEASGVTGNGSALAQADGGGETREEELDEGASEEMEMEESAGSKSTDTATSKSAKRRRRRR
jgi:preprotein translocase subunit SecA